jgi:hypothetical protein
MPKKTFKIGNRVIGKTKAIRSWRGHIVRIFPDEKKEKYAVLFANGQTRTVFCNAIDLDDVNNINAAQRDNAIERTSDVSDDHSDNGNSQSGQSASAANSSSGSLSDDESDSSRLECIRLVITFSQLFDSLHVQCS